MVHADPFSKTQKGNFYMQTVKTLLSITALAGVLALSQMTPAEAAPTDCRPSGPGS